MVLSTYLHVLEALCHDVVICRLSALKAEQNTHLIRFRPAGFEWADWAERA